MKKIDYCFQDISEFKKGLPKKSWFINCIEKEKRSILKIVFIFCSDTFLKEINKKYLNHDMFTDVVTLDYSTNNKLLGDVFISINRVAENAVLYKESFDQELARVMIHGVLHLVGYHDKSVKEKKIIIKLENKYLKEKNI